MKKWFCIAVFLCSVPLLFSQTPLSNSPTYYINPKPDSGLSPFWIDRITRETPISPSIMSERYEITFSIKDDSGDLVYEEKATNKFENARELFFTEGDIFGMRIPEFFWNGQYRQEYKDLKLRGYQENFVPDGTYTLVVEMNTEIAQRGKMGIEQTRLREYTIVVDTTPLEFELRTIVSREDSLARSGLSLYANEFARKWTIFVDGNPKGASITAPSGIMTIPLPVQTFSGEEYAGEHTIRVEAMDIANNSSFREYPLVITTHTAGGGSFTPPQGDLSAEWERLNAERKALDDEWERFNSERDALGQTPPKAPIASLPNPTGGNPLEPTPPKVPVAPLPIKIEGGRRYLDIPDIAFLPFKSSYFEPGNSLKNVEYIKSLAASIMSQIDEIQYLHIDGYAFPTKLNSTRRALQTEHDEVLKPLSLARAEDIKDMLVLLGIPREKIQTRGLGASEVIANPKNGTWRESQGRRVRLWIE